MGVYKIGENEVKLEDKNKYKFIDNVIDYTLGYKRSLSDSITKTENTEDTTTTYTETATLDTIIVNGTNFYYKGKSVVKGEVITMKNGTDWDINVKEVKEEALLRKKQQKQQQLMEVNSQVPTVTAAPRPVPTHSSICHECGVKPPAIKTGGHCMYCWLVKIFGGVYKTGDHIVGERGVNYNQNDVDKYNFIDNLVLYIKGVITAKFLIKSKITLDIDTNIYTIKTVGADGYIWEKSIPINTGFMFYNENQKVKKMVHNNGKGKGEWVEEAVVFKSGNIETAKTNYTDEIKSSTEEIKSPKSSMLGSITRRFTFKKQPAQLDAGLPAQLDAGLPDQLLRKCTEDNKWEGKCSNNSYLNIPPYYCRKHALKNPVIWEKRE